MTIAKKVHVIGIVGLPANYGGFETLVENLAQFHFDNKLHHDVTVHSERRESSADEYLNFKICRNMFKANGIQSIPYDVTSCIKACISGADSILVLGVSGAIVFPFIRAFSRTKIICNVDGIEWRREKWKGLGKAYLKLSERIAAKYSHEVIADNDAVRDHLIDFYDRDSVVIGYGGDHSLLESSEDYNAPYDNYFFKVCRIEPENNIHVILDSFSELNHVNLVIVGNWDKSTYGKKLRDRYMKFDNIFMLDPIYDKSILFSMRSKCIGFIHGHSAGGTNPSLVEAMHFGKPIVSYDCSFNRKTTNNSAVYFRGVDDLRKIIMDSDFDGIGRKMKEVATSRYMWNDIAHKYFSLMM